MPNAGVCAVIQKDEYNCNYNPLAFTSTNLCTVRGRLRLLPLDLIDKCCIAQHTLLTFARCVVYCQRKVVFVCNFARHQVRFRDINVASVVKRIWVVALL